MAYILINQHTGDITYPYSIAQLRNDNPGVSFPQQISSETLASWNVFPVEETPFPVVDYNQNVIEAEPENVNGIWVRSWNVVTATQAEVDKRIAEQWVNVREERNDKLSSTDWTQLPDAPESSWDWKKYRQALRDVTLQVDPFNIVWPTVENL